MAMGSQAFAHVRECPQISRMLRLRTFTDRSELSCIGVVIGVVGVPAPVGLESPRLQWPSADQGHICAPAGTVEILTILVGVAGVAGVPFL